MPVVGQKHDACHALSPDDDASSECSVVVGQQRCVYRCLCDALANPAVPNGLLSCSGSRICSSHHLNPPQRQQGLQQVYDSTAQLSGVHGQARAAAAAPLPWTFHDDGFGTSSAYTAASSDCRHDIRSYVQQWLQAAEAQMSSQSHATVPALERAEATAAVACASTVGLDHAVPTQPLTAPEPLLPPPAFYILGIVGHQEVWAGSQTVQGHAHALDLE